MNKQNLTNKLINILALKDDDIMPYIYNELKTINCKIDEDKIGNIIITKGMNQFKPCVTAHLDSYHDDCNVQIIQTENWIMGIDKDKGCQSTIGADDRNGIILALALLKTVDNIKVIFCQDEEMGCIGSNQLKDKQLKGISYLIGLDRKSTCGNEAITFTNGMDIASKGFKNLIKPILTRNKYILSDKGVYSDIGVLCEKTQISGINLSVGYYREHTSSESVNINDFINAYDVLVDMIKNIPSNKQYGYNVKRNYQKSLYKGSFKGIARYSNGYFDLGDTYLDTHLKFDYCPNCGKLRELTESYYGKMCKDCLTDYTYIK